MAPTLQQTVVGYGKMYDRATINKDMTARARSIAVRIKAAKPTYDEITDDTGVPYFFIGPVHMRESSLNFKTHLHCGDPLTARTVHVPKGRPKTGTPPFTFRESAVDALTMPPHALDKVRTWSLERTLYEMEKYNGWGYLKKTNSPYLWSWTSEYSGGKYVADGKYSSTHQDQQPGTVAILKALAEIDPAVASALKVREAHAPQDVVADAVKTGTKKARNTRKAGGVVAAGGAGGETLNTGTVQPDAPPKPLVSPYVTYGVIGLGLVIVVVASIVVWRKGITIPNVINEKWG